MTKELFIIFARFCSHSLQDPHSCGPKKSLIKLTLDLCVMFYWFVLYITSLNMICLPRLKTRRSSPKERRRSRRQRVVYDLVTYTFIILGVRLNKVVLLDHSVLFDASFFAKKACVYSFEEKQV